MRRLLLAACLLPLVSSGCAICCAPFDCYYPYVGGAWVRTDPVNGRVGSAFYNAGAPASAMPVAATEPTPAQQAQPAPAGNPPAARSVIPRNMGQSYLP